MQSKSSRRRSWDKGRTSSPAGRMSKSGAGSGPAGAGRRDLLYFALIILLSVLITISLFHGIFSLLWGKKETGKGKRAEVAEPEITEEYLTVSDYNRPGIPLKKVTGIVIHYVANPASTAEDNRNYFENLAVTRQTKASCHYLVGLEGEILAIVPTDEIAYCSNEANDHTISIECCHPDEGGKFSDATYESAVHLTAWLCSRYGLSGRDVIRHYDVTGKMCPAYYVKHQDAWDEFLEDVDQLLYE